MNIVTYIQKMDELEFAKSCGITEVICSTRDFSRDTNTSRADFDMIVKKAKRLNLRVVFEWDIIETESLFSKKCDLFKTIDLTDIDVIRVQDLGCLKFVLDNTNKPIQFIRENSDHNFEGLKTWATYIGTRLDRLVLSNEFNKDKIQALCESLNCDLEILVYGKILLFYTPRGLLSALKPVKNGETIKALGSSEESPHSGFPLIENEHGTFMYHIKDLYLMDKYSVLETLGLTYIRVDLRDRDFLQLKELCLIDSDEKGNVFKDKFQLKTTRGYFQTNKSDVLFKKLKNYRVQRKDESYIGEIIEIQNKEYMAVLVKAGQLKLNDKVKIISPEGREFETHLASLRDANMQDQLIISKGQLAILKYKGGVWPKSQVYLQ